MMHFMSKKSSRKSDQAAEIVISQFENQLDLYSEHTSVDISQVVPFLKTYFTKHKSAKTIKICEFGGGGGNLLKAIKQSLKHSKLELHNVELVGMYKKAQVSKDIHFTQGSVLNPEFDDATFDVVIVRNVLHHLIAPALRVTRDNQQQALDELSRITKKGGLVLIEEQVNNNPLACSIFFYASWLATKLKLNIKSFQITPSTIVGYMTQSELRKICRKVIPTKFWLENTFTHWPPELHWRLTMLMNQTGSAFIAMKKP